MNENQDHPQINRNIHPPVVALIHIALAYLLGWLVRIPFAVPPILRTTGLLMTFIGFLLGTVAFIEFNRARTTLDPHGSATGLVTTGIYRFTRNPIYLGFLLMIIGLPLTSGFYTGFLLAPLYMIAMNRLVIEREETYLQRKFKDQYAGYRSHVRRWV